MPEILNQLLEQLNSSVFVLIAILLLAFWFSFKIGTWKETFLNHAKRIENVESLAHTVTEIKTKVDLIYQNTNPQALYKSQSPISLTRLGAVVAENVGAAGILDKNYKKLKDLVEKGARDSANAYDIQQTSFAVAKNDLRKLLSENELGSIKTEAFDRGLPADEILALFGILLRNRILEEKGIAVSEVDDHTPGH